MHRPKLFRLYVLILMFAILAGCNQPVSVPTSTANTAGFIDTGLAQTSAPVPTQTRTVGTATIGLSTPFATYGLKHTLTPWPTTTPKPTFTPGLTATPLPTYDPAQVIVRTPETAVCPPVVPGVQVDLELTGRNPFDDYPNEALRNLALGAEPEDVVAALNLIFTDPRPHPLSVRRDLTGDRVPEIIISVGNSMYVLGCDQGEYRILQTYTDYISLTQIVVEDVMDMNGNGIPEVLVSHVLAVMSDTVWDIFEWDGEQFIQLLQPSFGEWAYLDNPSLRPLYWYHSSDGDGIPEGYADYYFQDLDNNSTVELILHYSGSFTLDTRCNKYGPLRGKELVYTWDGIHFSLSTAEYDPPAFRFEAVQDADRLFLLGDYPRALSLYQDVIFSDKLLSWSEEAYQYLRDLYNCYNTNPTPIPPPYNDDEYHKLAAYARYRIILHHLTQGWEDDAETVLTTFRETTPAGSPGYPYLEMAELLWANYQESGETGSACVAVIEYAAGHEEFLEILNGAQGLQNHRYSPEDICPIE